MHGDFTISRSLSSPNRSSYAHKRTDSDVSGTYLRVGGWENLVDSAEHLGQANTREDKKQDNMGDKCCEPTHPPKDPDGKFL